MFWLWLIVVVLINAVGVYLVGRWDLFDDEKIAMLWIVFFGSIAWPIILVIAIIIGPFLGLFWLGNRHRKKQNTESDK